MIFNELMQRKIILPVISPVPVFSMEGISEGRCLIKKEQVEDFH